MNHNPHMVGGNCGKVNKVMSHSDNEKVKNIESHEMMKHT